MKLTLIGSTKFVDIFHASNKALTLMGNTVYSLALFDPTLAAKTDSADKIMLDLVHFHKIINSELIVLIGGKLDGTTTPYLGFSTAREIMWSVVAGLPVYDSRLSDWTEPQNWPIHIHNMLRIIAEQRHLLGSGLLTECSNAIDRHNRTPNQSGDFRFQSNQPEVSSSRIGVGAIPPETFRFNVKANVNNEGSSWPMAEESDYTGQIPIPTPAPTS